MKFDVIILAGALGTRLASVVSDVPKPMAPVAGKPFLDFILQKLPIHNIGQIILAVGYKHEKIEEYYGQSYNEIPIVYSIEEEPLGTGGGISLALKNLKEDHALVLNGDTYFDVDYEALWQSHQNSDKPMTLALKQIDSPDRYGTVLLQKDSIVRFQEKKEGLKTGLINGGVYWLSSDFVSELPKMEKYSFESEVLEKKVKESKLNGHISSGLFIDIGIPEDYERAQQIFA